MFKKLFFTAGLLLGASLPVLAETHNHNEPSDERGFYGHLNAQVYVTDVYDAAEDDEEIHDSFTHTHVNGGYKFNQNWSVNGMAMLEGEPAGHTHGAHARAGDHFFDDTPLYIKELTLNYDDKNFGGYVGKFSPAFGKDSHDVPGWMGSLAFHDFEVKERLGFGGYVTKDFDKIGQQRLDVSTFYADTSFLNESILYDRDTTDHEDGGAGNTEDFSSLSTRLSGQMGLDTLSYYLGYMHQGVDQAGETGEDRFAVGLEGAFPLNDDWTFNPMIDLTQINHLDGEGAHDRIYSTVGFDLTYQQWVLGGTYTDIDNSADDHHESMDGYNAQLSVGYNFVNGIGIDIGHQWKEDEGERTDRLGGLLRYQADF